MPSSVGERESEPAASINDALDALERASQLPAKQRSVKVSGIVSSICDHAFAQGLDAESLRRVVRTVSRKTELDQSSVTTLVKNLYPAHFVPSDVIITVVGALGQGKGKPAPGTQNSLVRWLVIVHEIIEEQSTLSRLYGVLFGMLDMISIRTPLCHLLSIITRRKHVKPFRIQQLLELSRGLSNEPALQGLLRIFKDYYPDIILGSTATTRSSFPPRPDPEWQTKLQAIQDANTASRKAGSDAHNGFRVLRKGPKRGKISVVPDVHTFRANETSVTLEGIDNAEAFVENLDKIEPPGQIISYLNDPLLQKFVALRPSPILSKRINLWLSVCLEEEFALLQGGSPPSVDFPEVFEGLLRQTQYDKKILPIVLTFLNDYLLLWDGITAVDAIFGLLSYLPIQDFQDAYTSYLKPAETALLTKNLGSIDKIFHLYTDLLRHWISELNRLPESQSPTPGQTSLRSLETHVSFLSTSLLLSVPSSSNTPLTASILTFYETLSSSSSPTLIPIILPSPHLSYLLAQSPSLPTLSRLSGIYAAYKTSFDRHPHPISTYYTQATLNSFNSCLRDLYNLLWGSKALFASPGQSSGFFVHPAVRDAFHAYLTSLDRDYPIGHAFGLSYNGVVASIAAIAWRVLEDEQVEREGWDRESVNWHKGPVTARALDVLRVNRGVTVGWEAYRLHVLGWMAERGCRGVKDLLFATHARLKERAAREKEGG
ncbi:Mis6-domain-containing protein [Aaosphaeria arxii CBS 175.79]|uniref:Mis6-domain-containing protein n=1 Tax=Aaosphaeria arxii CBS 175.79 TaxID=1450172 RepID=A0A6A5XUU9_9PLEO|nr:Mis6-domain-containing protein [Aaosphaeria arxii CBS 175.79]KAF2016733.1 Mis6-domain-containing protein [Aaosphaeria arxii CBS 175.79]